MCLVFVKGVLVVQDVIDKCSTENMKVLPEHVIDEVLEGNCGVNESKWNYRVHKVP